MIQDSQPGILRGVAVAQFILPPEPALNTGSEHELVGDEHAIVDAGEQPKGPPAKLRFGNKHNKVIKTENALILRELIVFIECRSGDITN